MEITPNSPSDTLSYSPLRTGDRFQVLRPHARGGLGQVSVARDEELNREVALKEILPDKATNPDACARFLLEAEVTGRLEHPGIVPVYALGQRPDGRPYYAMRFIRGESLKDAIQRFHGDQPANAVAFAGIEFRQLVSRFVQVCNAIAYAHSRGVLHRDLKPANIMLGTYGETLVVDWGLAKAGKGISVKAEIAISPSDKEKLFEKSLSDETTLAPLSRTGSNDTVAGTAIGTPGFMSPEQAAGRLDLVTTKSDIYSLGATLYMLLTGKVAFEGDDTGELLRRVQRGEFEPPKHHVATVPRALEAVCLKAMALDPKDRYTDVLSLAADIEHWLADEPVTAYAEPISVRMRRWMRGHRTLVGIAGAAALLTVCFLTAFVLVLHFLTNP